MELRVARVREGAKLPQRAHEGDAGLDLCAIVEETIGPGERAIVPTGIAVEIPDGHAGLVLPRSGLAACHGITLVNAPGLIDASYRGEVRVLLLNTDRTEPFTIASGDRVAQLLVVPFAEVEPVAVAELALSARGEGGFGSTGR
jgi:dUTP diphosphatase